MAQRVAKITISIPVDLLDSIDGLAAESGESRSFVVREAAAQYLTRRREADAAATRRRGVDHALEIMQGIRDMPLHDDRSGLEILRELRDSDDFTAPPPGDPKAAGGEAE